MTAIHLSCQQASCCSPVCFRSAARLQRQTVCSKPSHEELPLSQSPVSVRAKWIYHLMACHAAESDTKCSQTDLCYACTLPFLPTNHLQVLWRSPRPFQAKSLFPHSDRAQLVWHRCCPVAPPLSTKPSWSLYDTELGKRKKILKSCKINVAYQHFIISK